MQLLLAGVFTFFGLHTILWLYRGLAEMRKRRATHEEDAPAARSRQEGTLW
jgi:hypothetical protein